MRASPGSTGHSPRRAGHRGRGGPPQADFENGKTRCRHLVPRSTIQRAAAGFRSPTAPLLEEKGHASRAALIENLACPLSRHGAASSPALAADNHPIDSLDRQVLGGTEQWLYREKSDGGRDRLQVPNTPRGPSGLDG